MRTVRVPERTTPAAPFQKNASDRQAGQELPAQSRSPLPRNRPPSFRRSFSCDRFPETISGSDAVPPSFRHRLPPPPFPRSSSYQPRARRRASGRHAFLRSRLGRNLLRSGPFRPPAFPFSEQGQKTRFPPKKIFSGRTLPPFADIYSQSPGKTGPLLPPTPPGWRKILSLARPFFRVKAKNFPKTSLD